MTSRSIFAPGNTVQVIDPEEVTSEWATFIIAKKEVIQVIEFDENPSNQGLNKQYQYLLKPTNKTTYDEPLWVLPEEICPTTLTPA